MIDLFGRRRIAELEEEVRSLKAALAVANSSLQCERVNSSHWENEHKYSTNIAKGHQKRTLFYLDEVKRLKGHLLDINEATQHGKSGTAQKVARMAWKALEMNSGH